jgi:hypothetical protein
MEFYFRNAWHALSTMSVSIAEESYISLVSKLDPNWIAVREVVPVTRNQKAERDGVSEVQQKDEEEDDDSGGGGGGGFGISVSTVVASEEEKEEEAAFEEGGSIFYFAQEGDTAKVRNACVYATYLPQCVSIEESIPMSVGNRTPRSQACSCQ